MEPAYPASILDDSTSPIGRDTLQEAGLVHSFFRESHKIGPRTPSAGSQVIHGITGMKVSPQ